MKNYNEFINENINNKTEVEEYLLKLGAEKVNGRWNYNGSITIDSKFVYKEKLLVSFGIIGGDFICKNKELRNESLKNLPTSVKHNLMLNGNHFTDLKDFNVKIGGSINLSHNHLHELKNIQSNVKGSFNISSNMITSLEGCPKEVGSFNCIDNWLKTSYNAPNKIYDYVSSGYNTSTGADVILDNKISDIEQEFYKEKSYYNIETKKGGIQNYWSELFQYILEEYVEDVDERNKAIDGIIWPDGMKADLMKTSLRTISKFSL